MGTQGQVPVTNRGGVPGTISPVIGGTWIVMMDVFKTTHCQIGLQVFSESNYNPCDKIAQFNSMKYAHMSNEYVKNKKKSKK